MVSSLTRRVPPCEGSARICGAVVHVEALDDASGGVQDEHRVICGGLLLRGSCVSSFSMSCFGRRSVPWRQRSSRPTRRQLQTSW